MNYFETKKSLGQHFLRNPETAGKIADAGTITPGETVLEIGPGTGILTEALLRRDARVVAVEADPRAAQVLKERFNTAISEGRLTIHEADIREIDLSQIGLKNGHFSVIANIPYYISGLLFRIVLTGSVKPHTVVFLVQKEVAERIARSKKESLLSLGVKAYGDPEYLFTVKKGGFVPPPKVDSAVIRINNISRKRLKQVSDDHFFDVVKLGFAARRKQLMGALKSEYGEEKVVRAFNSLSLDHKVRGEDVSLDTWVALAALLNN